MKVIIAGDRNCDDYDILKDAVKKAGFKISEIVQGGARGIDSLAKQYAEEKGIPCTEFKADWENLEVENVRVKTRWDKWKKCDVEYNAMAGFNRNQAMAEYADALIAIQPTSVTPGTHDMIQRAKKAELEVFIYDKKSKDNQLFKYKF